MRHPLWILNSSLLLLLLISIGIVMVTQQRVPRWISIEPTPYIPTMKKGISSIDLAKIYENDLFDTYKKAFEPAKQKPLEEQFPEPPTRIPVKLPEPETPKFLDPLQITLKGVIMMGDDQKNRAIVANNKTKVENNIKIGDKIEDAQLIRIFRNRAIFIRSNGQEETFYLRERDAKEAPEAQTSEQWDGVIKKAGPGNFFVDPEGFKEIVPNLAEFITALDLTTVYRKGQPIGVRVGMFDATSFAQEFELALGDIITSINGTKVTTVKDRLAAYNKITTLPLGKTIEVTYLRNNIPEKITLTLQDLEKEELRVAPAKRIKAPRKTLEDIMREKEELLQQKHIFAPTVDEIRKHEKRTLLHKVKKVEQRQLDQQRPPQLDI